MKKQSEKIKNSRRLEYRNRQRSTSIYFLLWAVFSVFSLFIVLFFGFSQRYMMTQTYKNEAVTELAHSGQKIQSEILYGNLSEFDGNPSAQLRYLSEYYDVRVYVLNSKGEVLLPNFEGDTAELFDFSSDVEGLKKRLEGKNKNTPVLYEGEKKYCYGAEIPVGSDDSAYLLVTKSLTLLHTVNRQLTVRTWISALFVFVLSFAVSSAVAGILIRPLTEVTQKERRLAGGDFDVDFHGADYGKEMVELANALNFARDELAKTSKMQKDLIANVSHDFKTPLTMIKAYASMIQEISGGNPEKRNKHAQVIVDEADRLTSLVTDVLDLSKITSGIDGLKLSTFNLSTYLKETVARFDYLKDTKGYQIIADIDERLYVVADELKIGQATYNLIGNAVNYTGEDKKVTVRLKKISSSECFFSVTDTGEGIKPEDKDSIWERYYRSKETHKRPVQGTGLGLSIVKAILQKHGFVFGVESKEGEGTTFYVRFPLVDNDFA